MRNEGRLRELAERQHGVVSFAQGRRLGIPSDALRDLGRSDRWSEVTPRVLRVAGAPPSRGDLLMAAVLDVGCSAVASHHSAAWWWGLPGFNARERHLTTTSSSRRTSTLARVHKVRVVPDRWVTVLDGVPVVRPELMVLQLCGSIHRMRAARALDNAWRDRLLSGASIDLLLDEVGRSGRNGVGVLRELRAERVGDYVPPASNLERRATDVLDPLGLHLVRQVESGGDLRWVGRVDLRDRRLPLIVEVQSEKFHSALLDVEADARRRAELEQAGFVVVEITDEELWTAPEVARARVAAAAGHLRRHPA